MRTTMERGKGEGKGEEGKGEEGKGEEGKGEEGKGEGKGEGSNEPKARNPRK